MRDKLRVYIDGLFKDAPPTKKTVELKEEILQNLIDKYDDLIMEGKSEEAAYNIAVAGVGDISALIADLGEWPQYQDPAPFPTEEYEKSRRRSAILIPIAVALYILCIIPTMLISSDMGTVLMFIMIAIATGLLIYNNMMKVNYRKMNDTVVEEFREWNMSNRADRQIYKALSGALWAIVLALYFIISFATMAWYVTWVIFLIGGALNGVLKAVFDLIRPR